MLGAIIGDIVGSRFEFKNTKDTRFELFHPDCNFTDDTICTCAVADWVLHGNGYAPENSPEFARMLQGWCHRYPKPMGGYGGRFAGWIQNPVPYQSFGNGAAMRISPVALMPLSFADQGPAVDLVTSVSHNHPEGLKGAHAIATAIRVARLGADKAGIYASVSMFGYNLSRLSCDEIRRTNSFNETCQVTVPQAVQAFLESSDFESAIRLAVSLGGDSDTIAAMTGSIAEAYYEIPDDIARSALRYLTPEMLDLVRLFYKKLKYELQVL